MIPCKEIFLPRRYFIRNIVIFVYFKFYVIIICIKWFRYTCMLSMLLILRRISDLVSQNINKRIQSYACESLVIKTTYFDKISHKILLLGQ